MDKILLQDFDHVYINLLTQTRQAHPQHPSATLTGRESLGVPSDIEEVDEGMEDPESEAGPTTHIPRDGKRQSSVAQSHSGHSSSSSSSESVIEEPMLT